MKNKLNDTIVAVSTALSNNAISIIRLSGDEAISIVNKIFNGKDLTTVDSHTIHYGYIYDKDNGENIDEVLVSIFKSPRSYTTEDVVEINCHGGVFVTSKVFDLLVSNGARIAEPGEFTKRAFLNGRIDLTKAEAVMDMISSENNTALKFANNHLRGDIYNFINNLRKEIFDIIGKINVNIDYPEYDDVDVVTNEYISPKLKKIKNQMENILSKSKECLFVNSGINTAIVGKPNVGKSSLLNLLINESKAIVTNIPGTTRDIVEGKVMLGGITLNLIDTAGIHNTTDIIEKIGVEKSEEAIEKADLIFLVFDSSKELDNNDYEMIERLKNKKVIYLFNKNDLENKLPEDILDKGLSINTVDKNIIAKIEKEVIKFLHLNNINYSNETILANSRQIGKMEEALSFIIQAEQEILDKAFIDFIEMPLKEAWISLGEITGEVSNEDLLSEMFGHFCLGK